MSPAVDSKTFGMVRGAAEDGPGWLAGSALML